MELRKFTRSHLTAVVALAAVAFWLSGEVVRGANTLPPFGNGGRVVTAFSGAHARLAGLVSSRTKVIVAGTVRTDSGTRSPHDDDEDFVVARYLPTGRLDPSFGRGGIVRTDLGARETATDVALDPFGRIVVVGHVTGLREVRDSEALIARYTSGGRLDSTFGDGGVVRAGRGGALAVVTDQAGRILFAGGTTLDPPLQTDNPWRIVRLTEDGSFDPSFGGDDGVVTGDVSAQSNVATDLTIDAQGRVVFTICGQSVPGAPVFAVGRLGADGAPDPSFGEGGLTRIAAATWNCPYAIARDRHGRVVVAGNGDRRIVAARLRLDGSLDPSFSADGRVSLDFREAKVRLGGIAIDPRGGVVLAGRIAPSMDQLIRGPRYAARMLLVKLRTDGGRDRRFGGDGDVAIRFGADRTFDCGAADVTLRNRAIYAAGTAMPHLSISPPGRFALVRLSSQALNRSRDRR